MAPTRVIVVKKAFVRPQAVKAAAPASGKLRSITMEEVEKHSTKESVWFVRDGKARRLRQPVLVLRDSTATALNVVLVKILDEHLPLRIMPTVPVPVSSASQEPNASGGSTFWECAIGSSMRQGAERVECLWEALKRS